MGITSHTKDLIEGVINEFKPKTVCELGAQNMYDQPGKAPYASGWYESKKIKYTSIDVSKENGALDLDLTKPIKDLGEFDLVTDAGTGEHCGRSNADFYQVMKNIHTLCKIGGIVIRENPKTGNWPGHGFHYMTEDFYREFEKVSGYKILKLGQHPAMGNTTDGWNIYCVMQKVEDRFPTKKVFATLPYFSE